MEFSREEYWSAYLFPSQGYVYVCVCMYVRIQNTKIVYNTLNKRLTSSLVPGTRILVFWLLIQCTLSILFFFFAFTYNFKIINITMRSISRLSHFELYNKYDIHVCLHIHICLSVIYIYIYMIEFIFYPCVLVQQRQAYMLPLFIS